MGFLNILLGGGAAKQIEMQVDVLSNTVDMLSLGIFKYLSYEKYAALGKDEAALLGIAVLNIMTLQDPGNEQEAYYRNNSDKISRECSLLKNDSHLSGRSGGLSHYYGARLLMLTSMAKHPNTTAEQKEPIYERMQSLERQAQRFGIWVPESHDISTNNDPNEGINYLHSFAQKYIKS